MTIFEQTLRDLLIAINVAASRVFLIRAPQVPADQQQTPYLVFFHLAPSPHYAHDGPLQLMDREYQISVFDFSQSVALAIADTLRASLEGTRGVFENVEFGAVFHRTQTHAYESDTRLFQVVQQYRILYRLLDQTRNPTRSTNRTSKQGVRV